MKRLARNLLENSIEAYIHALETINRPSVKYRMETFCFLFCNACELLMKAKLLKEKRNIFYPKKRNQPRRSLSLEDCCNKLFTSESDPIKSNIRKIYDLRCDATHLVIPFVPRDIMGLFQAGVINYPKMLQDWFGINLSDKVPLGMMVLIYDFDPQKHSLEHARVKKKIPKETIKWLTEFQSNIRKQAAVFGEKAQQYFVPIDLKLAIIKNPNKADIVLNSGNTGDNTLILEVPKDIDKTHPHRRKELTELINDQLNGSSRISPKDIDCIKVAHNLNNRNDFVYSQKIFSPKYSDAFAEWIISQINKDKRFILNTRKSAYKIWHS
jgi:hypothetical protein